MGRVGRAVGGWLASNIGNAASTPLQENLQRMAWSVWPCKTNPIETLQTCLLNSTIHPTDFRTWMLDHGFDYPQFDTSNLNYFFKVNGIVQARWGAGAINNILMHGLRAGCNDIGFETAVNLWNRGVVDESVVDDTLFRDHIKSPNLRWAMKQLAKNIPGPSDLINFAVRECFDPVLLTKFGYQNEFPQQLYKFMEQQGYGWNITPEIVRPAGVGQNGEPIPAGVARWSDLFWWSHWELPSLTQGYEMFHRLYNDSTYGASPDWRNGITFDATDLESLQKAQDIPTYWRQRLQAISYSPLTRVDVRRMHKLGVLDDGGVYHAYRQIGYNDFNAKALLDFTKKSNSGELNKGRVRVTKEQICRNYTLGTIDFDQSLELMDRGGINFADQLFLLQTCEVDAKYRRVKEAVSYIRRGFLNGSFSRDDAREEMIILGLPTNKAEENLNLWALALLGRRREITAGRLAAAFLDSLISEDELTARLQNLHYKGSDLSLLVMQAKRKKEAIAERHMRVIRKKRIARRRRLLRSMELREKEAARQLTAQQKRTLAVSTPARMKKWYRQGLLPIGELWDRLLAKGWSEFDAATWIRSELGDSVLEELNRENPQAEEGQT